MSNIIELAKKLNELAKRGEGGEKINAQQKLRELMLKHNISEADLEIDEIKPHDINVSKAQDDFFFQLCSSIRKDMWISVAVGTGKNRNRRVKCTDAEFIELIEKFDVLWKHYQKELKVFWRAFVAANDLYEKPDPNEQLKKVSDLTKEERDEYYRIQSMARSIDKKTVNKLIEKQ